MADFDERCGPLDPKKGDDAWDDCRNLSARFLEDLLMRAPWREAVPFEGVRTKGSGVAENVDLENAKLIRPIEIVGCRIEGNTSCKQVGDVPKHAETRPIPLGQQPYGPSQGGGSRYC